MGTLRQRSRVGHRARGLQQGRAGRGNTSRTTMPDRAPIAGTRTASPASAIASRRSASRWRCGTGSDPILKERFFGLTGPEGNHGEDVKEYYFYLDSTPTHSYMRMLYKYPQRAFPYDDLVARNRARTPRRARVRTDRHRHLRRPPLLRRHGRIRQGRRGRPADADHRRQPRPRGRAAARAADGVVPQHVVVVVRRREARTAGPSADGRGLGAAGRDAAVRHAVRVLRGPAAAAVHRERDQHPPPVRRPRRPGLPQGCASTISWCRARRPPSTPQASAPRRQRTTRSTCPPAAST